MGEKALKKSGAVQFEYNHFTSNESIFKCKTKIAICQVDSAVSKPDTTQVDWVFV